MAWAAAVAGIGRIAWFFSDFGNPPLYNPAFGTIDLNSFRMFQLKTLGHLDLDFHLFS
jgi:hypothetical protein